MPRKPNPRRTNGHQRNKLRTKIAKLGRPCHLCGHAIDYSLPAGHPMSYELDEIIPVSRGGDPLDESNVAPAHRICNQRKGNKLINVVKDGIDSSSRESSARYGLPTSQEW